MKNTLKIIVLLLLGGVFGVDPNEVSVMEGDSLILHTDLTEIQKNDQIDWRFKKADSIKLLVQISENKAEIKPSVDVNLRGRLQTDTQTGDLTIRNMRMKYSGLYEVEINNPRTSYKRFNVTVKESSCVFIASEVKSVSVKEGKSVTLHTDVKIQKGDLILWGFGSDGDLIVKGDTEDNKMSSIVIDERFKDRLKLDDQTGNFTITSAKTEDTGVYKLKISSSNKETKFKTFSVSVSEVGLSPAPVGVLCISIIAAAAAAAAVILYRQRISKKKLIYEKKKLEDEHNKQLDEMKTKQVTEGYPLLLVSGLADMKTDKELSFKPAQIEQILEETVIEWRFEETLIAEIKRNNITITQKGIEIFGERLLQLDKRSGDLTISYISMKHAGLYKVKIIYNKVTSYFLFNVIVKARVLTTQLRGPVTIPTGLKQIKDIHKIEWKFEKSPGDELLLAEIHGTSKVISEYSRERFNGRLIVDPNTGDLIINQVTAVDTGVYILHDMTGKRQWNYYVALFVPGKTRDVITLETGSEPQRDTRVEWSFSNEVNSKDKRSLVTGIIKQSSENKYAKGTFSGRLDINNNTGNLTITLATFTDAGFYTLKLIKTNGEISYRIFKVDFNELYTPLSDDKASTVNEDPQESVKTVYDVVNVVEKDKKMSVIEGDRVILPGDESEVQPGVQIVWAFKDRVIIRGHKKNNKGILETYIDDQQFKGRLELNSDDGSLIIKSISMKDSGYYEITIANDEETSRTRIKFNVIVSARKEPTARDPLLNV